MQWLTADVATLNSRVQLLEGELGTILAEDVEMALRAAKAAKLDTPAGSGTDAAQPDNVGPL